MLKPLSFQAASYKMSCRRTTKSPGPWSKCRNVARAFHSVRAPRIFCQLLSWTKRSRSRRRADTISLRSAPVFRSAATPGARRLVLFPNLVGKSASENLLLGLRCRLRAANGIFHVFVWICSLALAHAASNLFSVAGVKTSAASHNSKKRALVGFDRFCVARPAQLNNRFAVLKKATIRQVGRTN